MAMGSQPEQRLGERRTTGSQVALRGGRRRLWVSVYRIPYLLAYMGDLCSDGLILFENVPSGGKKCNKLLTTLPTGTSPTLSPYYRSKTPKPHLEISSLLFLLGGKKRNKLLTTLPTGTSRTPRGKKRNKLLTTLPTGTSPTPIPYYRSKTPKPHLDLSSSLFLLRGKKRNRLLTALPTGTSRTPAAAALRRLPMISRTTAPCCGPGCLVEDYKEGVFGSKVAVNFLGRDLLLSSVVG
ncbi:hypothetical protein J6590_032809 [Homalodisca vitripennis]|nr:hypothetical protein J6590_032809 [Homalodisca vitripennis]